MIRSIFAPTLLALAIFTLVVGAAPIANADHHEGAQADVAAPVEPAKDKMDGDEAADAKQAEKSDKADAAKDEGKEQPAPAAPAKPE